MKPTLVVVQQEEIVSPSRLISLDFKLELGLLLLLLLALHFPFILYGLFTDERIIFEYPIALQISLNVGRVY